MELYLSSYRLGNNTDKLIEWKNKNGNKIIVIPNAGDVYPDSEIKTQKVLDKCKDLEEIGFETQIIDLRDYFNNQEKMIADIGDIIAFYVIGGNVFCLRRAMKLSGFDEYLRNIANLSDYLYSGFSAGICVLAKDLHGIDLVDNPEKDPYNYGSIIWEGVGIIDFMPIPHYDTPNHGESHLMYDVVKYMEENGLPYVTLKDGEYLDENFRYDRKTKKL